MREARRCHVCKTRIGEAPIIVRPRDGYPRPTQQLPERLHLCSQTCLDLYHDSMRLAAMKS